MKQYKIIFHLVLGVLTIQLQKAQSNAYNFSYDESGNMTQRSLQVFQGARFGNTSNDSTQVHPPLNFKIFPNPSNTVLNIEGELPDDVQVAQLALLNMNGQILKQDIYEGKLKIIDVSNLKSGMYLLEIKYSKKEKTTYKIIVTN